MIFTSSTAFLILFNGTPHYYDTSTVSKVDYNGVVGKFTEAIFDDTVATDDYTATQGLSLTKVTRSGGVTFEFDSSNAQYLYIYSSDPSSTATVSLATGSGHNFYVGDTASNYSYLADPVALIYSELSGFSAQTVTGSGPATSATTTYAYVYSTTDATLVGDPAGSTITVNGVASTLADFPQEYLVGAKDGTDKITLHTQGGGFVAQPSYSYVSGTFNSASFLIGALYAADVTAQATNASDSAFFYSYPADTFNGTTGSSGSSLTGSVTSTEAGLVTFTTFTAAATGFQSVSVLASGAGTDVINLNSPGSGTFTSTPTVSTLAVGSVTVFNVLTYTPVTTNNVTTNVAIPSAINMIGKGNGTDVASLYDGAGTNSVLASGSTATLKRNLGTSSTAQTVAVTDFETVNAYQTLGDNDTYHEVTPLDFAFQTIGNWTSD